MEIGIIRGELLLRILRNKKQYSIILDGNVIEWIQTSREKFIG